MSPYMLVAAAAAVLMCACSAASEADQASAGSTNRPRAADVASSGGPATAPPEMRANETQSAPASDSAALLESSIPSDGARLPASPENLILNFRSPVRLREVTVHGSDGQTVPMMITAAGAVRSFSIPMPDLEPGSYTVRWRATGDTGTSLEGSLGFVIA